MASPFSLSQETFIPCAKKKQNVCGMTAKNSRGRYGILDIQDFEKTQTTLRLMNELAKDRKSGEEKGGLTLEAVEKELGIVNG